MIRCNPPWTEKILTKHWAALERRVGAQWMPVAMTEPRDLAQKRKQLADIEEAILKGGHDANWAAELQRRWRVLSNDVAKLGRKKKGFGFREYGTGHYGTVMPTQTKGVVIKVTTDQSEAAFVAAYLSMEKHRRPGGIIPYYGIVAIRSESHLKRPVFVLWREEAQYVGVNGMRQYLSEGVRPFEKDYYNASYRKVEKLVGNCLDAGRAIRKSILKRADAKQILVDAVGLMDAAWNAGARTRLPTHVFKNRTKYVAWLLVVFKQNADELQGEPMGVNIGRGLAESFNEGLLLADVHLNNIGMPTGATAEELGMTPIITDPGHAIALDDRFDNLRVEEV